MEVVALGGEVEILSGGEVGGVAGAEKDILWRAGRDASRTGELELRFAPGRNLARAAAWGFTVGRCITCACLVGTVAASGAVLTGVAGGGGLQHLQAVLLLQYGGQLVRGRFVLLVFMLELGMVFLRGVGEALLQGMTLFKLSDGFPCIELVTRRIGAQVGTQQQALSCPDGGTVLGFEFRAKACLVQALVVGLVTQKAQVKFGHALMGAGVVLQA